MEGLSISDLWSRYPCRIRTWSLTLDHTDVSKAARVKQPFQPMSECAKGNKQNNKYCSRSTNPPKEGFCPGCINNACQIHSVVRREEGQRQEDDSYAGEDQNSLVLGV